MPDQPARNSWATPFLRVSWYSNTYTGTSQRAEQSRTRPTRRVTSTFLSSLRTVLHLLNSMFVVVTRLRLS